MIRNAFSLSFSVSRSCSRSICWYWQRILFFVVMRWSSALIQTGISLIESNWKSGHTLFQSNELVHKLLIDFEFFVSVGNFVWCAHAYIHTYMPQEIRRFDRFDINAYDTMLRLRTARNIRINHILSTIMPYFVANVSNVSNKLIGNIFIIFL